jgi:carbonic anhydrase
MKRLIKISKPGDIFQEYRNTPVGLLFKYHNFNNPFKKYDNAELLIGMCMDNRKHLRIPDNFAYIIRTGGANLRYNEFQISYAITIGQIRYIALIGHNNCGMVNLNSRKDQLVKGLIEITGWNKKQAEDHFMHFAPMFEIGNEVDFVLSESKRLRLRYPKILIVPMMYLVEDKQLYLIKE